MNHTRATTIGVILIIVSMLILPTYPTRIISHRQQHQLFQQAYASRITDQFPNRSGHLTTTTRSAQEQQKPSPIYANPVSHTVMNNTKARQDIQQKSSPSHIATAAATTDDNTDGTFTGSYVSNYYASDGHPLSLINVRLSGNLKWYPSTSCGIDDLYCGFVHPVGKWQVDCSETDYQNLFDGQTNQYVWTVTFDYHFSGQVPAEQRDRNSLPKDPSIPYLDTPTDSYSDGALSVDVGGVAGRINFFDPTHTGGDSNSRNCQVYGPNPGFGFGGQIDDATGDVKSAGSFPQTFQDGYGDYGSSTMQWDITVHPRNKAPNVDAGQTQVVNPAEQGTLHGSATDPDNDALTYQWTQLSGTPVQWTSARNILQPTFTAPALDEDNDANNVLQFQLSVDDGHGNVVVAVTSVRIDHAPTPVLSMSPSSGTAGIHDTVTFDASKSFDPDPGDKIVSFDWEQKKANPDDPDVPIVFRSANSDVIGFTAPSVNKETKVVFTLSLRDSYGEISVTEASVLVKPGNRPPIAVAQEREDGVYVILDGSKSYDPDPDDKVVAYKWTQIDNTGIKADLRGTIKDPSQYFVQPKVNQRVTLSFSLKVTDTHGADSENDAIVNVVIDPCTSEEKAKVPQVEQELRVVISAFRAAGLTIGPDTLDLWMTGRGAELYPAIHPRPLSVSWLRSTIEIQLAQNALHDLFQGPHNQGTRSINSLSAFIDGLPNDGKGYDFTDNWDYAVPSGFRPTDYNIAIGGTQIHADGKFVATKGQFVPNGVTVSGDVKYSLLDRFDWNKGTFLGYADRMNFLEKCGHAAPFWSAATWKQSVQGLGQDLPNSPPRMIYYWRDRND